MWKAITKPLQLLWATCFAILGYLICANRSQFHHSTLKNKCICSDAMYMPIKQEVVLDALYNCSRVNGQRG